jgi:hypothetical protein
MDGRVRPEQARSPRMVRRGRGSVNGASRANSKIAIAEPEDPRRSFEMRAARLDVRASRAPHARNHLGNSIHT